VRCRRGRLFHLVGWGSDATKRAMGAGAGRAPHRGMGLQAARREVLVADRVFHPGVWRGGVWSQRLLQPVCDLVGSMRSAAEDRLAGLGGDGAVGVQRVGTVEAQRAVAKMWGARFCRRRRMGWCPPAGSKQRAYCRLRAGVVCARAGRVRCSVCVCVWYG
jgi:hypothetical protein